MNRLIPAIAAAALLAACAPATPSTGATAGTQQRGDRFVISRTELASHPASNMRDVITSLRPDWFQRTAGSNALGPTIYLDGRLLGEADVLRTVGPQSLERACYHTISAAQNRFGSQVQSPAVELVSLGRNPTWTRC